MTFRPIQNDDDIDTNIDNIETKLDTINASIEDLDEVASGSADSGNPVKVGGVYNATPPTLDDGDRGDMQVDVNGNVKVTQATKIFGEDSTNDIMKVEQQFVYKYQAAAAVNVIAKASAGYLKGIIIGADVAGAVIEISDHATDGNGAVIIKLAGATLMTSTGGYIPINCKMSAGISADLINQTDVTFIYR